MQQSAPQRPTSVTVIGWAAVGLGTLSVFSAAGALLISTFMPPIETFPTQPGQYFPTWPFAHMRAVAAGQILLAACAAATGFAFLRLRPWSRPALEVYAWVTLALLLAFSVTWVRTASSMGQAGEPFPMGLFAVGGLIPMAAFVAVNIVVIRTLRSREVRAALAGARDLQ